VIASAEEGIKTSVDSMVEDFKQLEEAIKFSAPPHPSADGVGI
jgi:hypothetical protein